MKSVLISIKSKYCKLIASGKKTVEVRKTMPKLNLPFKCYIYCTKDKENTFFIKQVFNGEKGKWAIPHVGNGKVIGEFVCDKFYDIVQFGSGAEVWNSNLETLVEPSEFIEMSCLSEKQIFEYIGNKDGYGWHISDLVIYDKPKELSEFWTWKKCNSCKVSGYESSACCFDIDCKVPAIITRPPQSWQFVEELGV